MLLVEGSDDCESREVLLTSQAVALTETQPPMARPTSGQLDHFSP